MVVPVEIVIGFVVVVIDGNIIITMDKIRTGTMDSDSNNSIDSQGWGMVAIEIIVRRGIGGGL